MSIHRKNPKRDENEKPIFDALRECGVVVLPTSGGGVPDGFTYYPRKRQWLPVEIKREKKGRATDKQKQWPVIFGEGVIPLLETIEQALDWVGVDIIKESTIGTPTGMLPLRVGTGRKDGEYLTIVYEGGAPALTIRTTTFANAKTMHDLAVIRAMNYRDFKQPLTQWSEDEQQQQTKQTAGSAARPRRRKGARG